MGSHINCEVNHNNNKIDNNFIDHLRPYIGCIGQAV